MPCELCPPNSSVDIEGGFRIELIDCILNNNNRQFKYEVTPVADPDTIKDISNILGCLCQEAFVSCNVEVTSPDPEKPPKSEFETNPNASGNPIACQGVKFENLGENKIPGSVITLFITVNDNLTTVVPDFTIAYKAGQLNFVWNVCGPECNGNGPIPPSGRRRRGIEFVNK